MLVAIKNAITQIINDDKRRLKHFSISAICFFIGYATLYRYKDISSPSLNEELIALSLLVFTLSAFVWAIFLQILHIISKIK